MRYLDGQNVRAGDILVPGFHIYGHVLVFSSWLMRTMPLRDMTSITGATLMAGQGAEMEINAGVHLVSFQRIDGSFELLRRT